MAVATKICGLTTREAVEAAAEEGAQFIGFVFYPASPRNVLPADAAALALGLPPTIRTVAVTVGADDALLADIMATLKPHFIQFHGKEPPERLLEIKERYKVGTIKAIKVRTGDDVAQAGKFAASADYLLFDAKAPESAHYLPGGNGLSFDWVLLKDKNFTKPWFLSGGLNKDNVQEAVRLSGALLVDISSSVESAPGVKSPELIREFMANLAGA